jgi:pyrimidine nucleoside transport protein
MDLPTTARDAKTSKVVLSPKNDIHVVPADPTNAPFSKEDLESLTYSRQSYHSVTPVPHGEDDGVAPEPVVVTYLKKLTWFKQAAILVVIMLLVAFNIAAIAINFSHFKAFFILEMIGVALFALTYLNANSAGWNSLWGGVNSQMGRFFNSKMGSRAVYLLLIGIMIAIVLWCCIPDSRRFQSFIGYIVLILLSFALSYNPRKIQWRPVVGGLFLQMVLGVIVLRTRWGYDLFDALGNQVQALLSYSDAGASFVFGYLNTGQPTDDLQLPTIFAFTVLPVVVFMATLVTILYYMGILQVVVRGVSVCMEYTLGTSAAESTTVAANMFLSMTETPLLVKPFLKNMTRSELHAVMTGGFATIAGSVMASYISFGISAVQLLSASIMSAPAVLAISKIIYPEDSEPETKAGEKFVIEKGDESNVFEAATNGASIGMQLMLNIMAMLMSFNAILAMLNAWTKYFGLCVGWENGSFEALLGYFFWPFAWLLGVNASECETVAQLIGIKVFSNEFIAYTKLTELMAADALSARAVTIATFALCSFANFGSIGITLGGLMPLAPNRLKDLSSLAFSAMVTGNTICFLTACVAGMVSDKQ